MTSQSQPATPVRVPKAAATYSPSTQDPDLRSQINTSLLRDGHVERIQSALSQSLAEHPSNWPSQISAHALSLLRSGEYTTFPKLMERVLADIRRDTEDAQRIEDVSSRTAGVELKSTPTSTTSSSETLMEIEYSGSNGSGVGSFGAKGKSMVVNGSGSGSAAGPGAKDKGKGKGKAKGNGKANGVVPSTEAAESAVFSIASRSLALPKSVVDEGVKLTLECLELVCEIEE